MDHNKTVVTMVNQTRRIRSRTTLGKIEALINNRSTHQRRQTVATNKLAEINGEISAWALKLAEEKFNAELEKAVVNER